MSVFASWRWRRWGLLALAALAQPGFAESTGTLTLAEALARVETVSPLLQAAGLDSLAIEARRVQALRGPRPTLGLNAENLAGTGDYTGLGASEWVLTLSREFDLAGRRSRQAAALGAEIGLLEADRTTTRQDLRLETALAFGEVWRAQEQVQLAGEQQDLARRLHDQVAARLAAGGSSAMEMTRAQVGLAAGDMTLRQAQANLNAALRSLASLWGGQASDFQAVALPDSFWAQAPAPFAAELVAGNPDLQRWDLLHTVQEFRLRAAEAAGGLDLELAAGLKLDNASGDKSLVLGAALPLPGGGRNRDEIRALGYERDRTAHLKRETTRRAVTALSAALAEQAAARREMDTLDREIIPLARLAHQEARLAHERGLYSLTDVLETRRSLFELRQAELDARSRFFTASAHIARLTGRPLLAPAPKENP